MKRSMLLVLAMAVAGLFPSGAFGQSTLNSSFIGDDDGPPIVYDSIPPQRIGLPPAEMELSSNGTDELNGFCFDEYLIAPTRVTQFPNVLAGNNDAVVRFADGSTTTLREAINSRKVAVQALQLGVKFRNMTDGPMHISMPSPVVLWDRPAGDVNPQAIAVLTSPNTDYQWRQNNVWSVTSAERRLGILGYLAGSVWDYNHDRVARAASAFQRDNGLSATGELGPETMSRLAEVDSDLRTRLRRLGFRDREGRSLKEDLASMIRAFERSTGRGPTGIWSPDLNRQLQSDEHVIEALNGVRTKEKSVADVLLGNGTDPSIATFLNTSNGTMFLVQSPRGVELWNRKGNGLSVAGRGVEGVRTMDATAANLASRTSRSGRVVIYPRVSAEGTTLLAFGNRTIQLNRSSLENYLDGGEIPAPLADVMAPYVDGVGSEPTGRRATTTFIVYRGPFVQGRGGDIGKGNSPLADLKLNQVDGAKLATALQRTYGEKIDLFVSDDLEIGAYRLGDAFGAPSDGTGWFSSRSMAYGGMVYSAPLAVR